MWILFWPQARHEEHTRHKITKGASLQEVSHGLLDKGIISNERTFLMAVHLLGHEKNIQAGVFQFRNISNHYTLIDQLVNGTPERKRIMIPEGLNMSQIAKVFVEKLGFSEEQFSALTMNKIFINSLGIKGESLEGYLFPDTYLFFEGDSPESVIKTMVKQYQSIWTSEFNDRLASMNMSEKEILTLASIIEGEVIYNSERPIISGVYHNRLRMGMKLQADPTIQYIILDGPRRLLNKDLKIRSPYNTYLNNGLPPGPINSPGKESIRAALYPNEHDYLFFVAKGDGKHTFTTNEKDHLKAKKVFQKIRRELKRKKNI
ncbi:MAG: endolytic transglycosylase MltG [Candidatus Marinimicrobia bacterium]|jgi:UPF0755 protein|nr:endolytic transglycosylase MltG [Candidatus Neomarinimicrobiota bacterium]MBT4143694.1 endolytic transglycosylase MltG [Candidatus Neomarinimicrobiota bacterium]MBT4177369.1 endolytic transglycosylase MltG [Candidatus Neomarinimicrobiota bacterium]MBT4593187.1 endolytic transglycosylase MltG [Candidatus Neomarinimicrobiota bacterium]MBT5356310.1 endolytic transglycosylase MltG [Candidatus Neomarinimicrobiota bacterium]